MLRENDIQGIMITKPENVFYLSGSSVEGFLLIGSGYRGLFTDFRYTEDATNKAKGYEIIEFNSTLQRYPMLLAKLTELGIKKLAFEDDYVSVAEYAVLKEEIAGVELVSAKNIPETMRMIKDEYEIQSLAEAQELSCKAFDYILGYIRPGMTEIEIKLELEYTMYRMGSSKISFDTIACAGPNGSLPHAVPSSRKVQMGELLTLDFGAMVNGYHADITRTIALGNISDELKAIYDTVLTAQLMALEAVKPDVKCSDVDAVARNYINTKYNGRFGHGLGHSVGLLIHEEPNFQRFAKQHLQWVIL